MLVVSILIKESVGEFGEAFTCYETAGMLRKSLLGYDIGDDEALFRNIKRARSDKR